MSAYLVWPSKKEAKTFSDRKQSITLLPGAHFRIGKRGSDFYVLKDRAEVQIDKSTVDEILKTSEILKVSDVFKKRRQLLRTAESTFKKVALGLEGFKVGVSDTQIWASRMYEAGDLAHSRPVFAVIRLGLNSGGLSLYCAQPMKNPLKRPVVLKLIAHVDALIRQLPREMVAGSPAKTYSTVGNMRLPDGQNFSGPSYGYLFSWEPR